VAVVLIASLILAQPTVRRSTAQGFFHDYFTNVTSAKDRTHLYENDLTSSFRQLSQNSATQYYPYWKKIRKVTVNSVFSVPGNSEEFIVGLTIHPRVGGPVSIRVRYWVVCTGFIGNLSGRFPFFGCPESDLEIDNEQAAPLGPGAS